jgi:hypothetical protein
MTAEHTTTFEAWAVVELLGRRRLAGKVSEQSIAGGTMLRIDIPTGDEQMTTQFYGNAAIFSITPTTEAIARSVAKRNQPEPVYRFELPAPVAPAAGHIYDGTADYGDDDDDSYDDDDDPEEFS